MFNALQIRIGVRLQHRLLFDEKGMLAVEHGLIVGLIAVVILGAAGGIGGTLLGWFGEINGGLSSP